MGDGGNARRARQDLPNEDGAAIVEFIALSLLLLVPLVYLVVTLSRVQAGAFTAEAAADQAARTAVVTGVHEVETGSSAASAMAAAGQRAEASVGLVAADFGFSADDASLDIACEGPCLEPGSNIATEVTVVVALPGIPGFLGDSIPLEIEVAATARAPVDSVVRDR